MKKLFAMVAVFTMALPCAFVYAAEPNLSETDDSIVPYHVYTITSQNGRSAETELKGDELIEYMNEQGQIPGSRFLVGNKKYEVTENYELRYLGVDETVDIDTAMDFARGTSIPKKAGTLPNSGTYKMSNYIYSNNYFNVGTAGSETAGIYPSIGVTISADQEQDIMVSWMDGRNNESMGNKTYYFNRPNEVTKYDWVYPGQNFYFKFTNKTSSKTISGSYNIYVDQY